MPTLPNAAEIIDNLVDIMRNPATLALVSSATFAAIGLAASVIARLCRGKRHAYDFVLIPALLTIVIGCTVFAYKQNATQPTTDTAKQAQLLAGRVKENNMFRQCEAATQPVAGAEATINCQAREAGITATASSFQLTGPSFPYNWYNVSNQSQGLDTFLTSNTPGLAPTPAWNQSGSATDPGEYCISMRNSPSYCNSTLQPKFSGYWGFPYGNNQYTIDGRLYCYLEDERYYIVWTVDNDSYESNQNEDFVVTVSGPNLAKLIDWWNKDLA